MFYFRKILWIVLFLIVGSWCWCLKTAAIAMNVSGSMPCGLYYRLFTNNIHRRDIVAVCLPTIVAREGFAAHYLLKGRCAESQTTPVLKTVIAVPGDAVNISSQAICVNQVCYPAPQQVIDRHGKQIQRFIYNGYHRARGYWLYGSAHSLFSWDSRYFGAVSRAHILGVYRKLRIFSSASITQKLPISLPIAIGSQIGSLNEVEVQ